MMVVFFIRLQSVNQLFLVFVIQILQQNFLELCAAAIC